MRGPLLGNFSSSLSETLPKETKNWKKDEKNDIETVFKKHGLEDYVSVMKQNLISFEDLKFLNKDDLVCMKIPIGPRNRILRIIDCMDKGEAENDENRFFNENKDFIAKKQVEYQDRLKKKEAEDVVNDILGVLKRISDKQAEMFEMIKENQREINDFNQFSNKYRKY
jgi:hypothetical protein